MNLEELVLFRLEKNRFSGNIAAFNMNTWGKIHTLNEEKELG